MSFPSDFKAARRQMRSGPNAAAEQPVIARPYTTNNNNASFQTIRDPTGAASPPPPPPKPSSSSISSNSNSNNNNNNSINNNHRRQQPAPSHATVNPVAMDEDNDEYDNYGPDDAQSQQSDATLDDLTLGMSQLKAHEKQLFSQGGELRQQIDEEKKAAKAALKKKEDTKKVVDLHLIRIIQKYEEEYKQEGVPVEVDGVIWRLERPPAGPVKITQDYVAEFLKNYLFYERRTLETPAGVDAAVEEMYSEEARIKKARKNTKAKPKLVVVQNTQELLQSVIKHR
jgi:hypothetical protein